MHHFAETAGQLGVRKEICRHLPTRAMVRDEVFGRVLASDIELLPLRRTAIRRLT